MGVSEYDIDGLWRDASELKATYGSSLGDAYAVAAARAIDNDEHTVTLLVGADDDYELFGADEQFAHLIRRFREESG